VSVRVAVGASRVVAASLVMEDVPAGRGVRVLVGNIGVALLRALGCVCVACNSVVPGALVAVRDGGAASPAQDESVTVRKVRHASVIINHGGMVFNQGLLAWKCAIVDVGRCQYKRKDPCEKIPMQALICRVLRRPPSIGETVWKSKPSRVSGRRRFVL
jgi:hypothetical protein